MYLRKKRKMKLIKFLKYICLDTVKNVKLARSGIKKFDDYGLTLFEGCQGAGKSISMIKQLNDYRNEYGNELFIATNCDFKFQDMQLEKFEDILLAVQRSKELGCVGCVIGWDEIQNDFDNQTRTYPIAILRTITQQRKQGIKILATSQVFTRVAKVIREQTFEVVHCKTFLNRWTFQKYYDAIDYEYYIANIEKNEKAEKLHPKMRYNFVQDDEIRSLYDSYAVIKSLEKFKDK
jgi:ATP-dependent Clp protease ATP-binding subunit ClpX